jgi:HEPN domain-containing protein
MTENQFMPWLEYAKYDYESARYLQSMRPVPLEVICYLCEQSTEKLLKGFLLANDQEAPKIHDLRELCKRCMVIDESFQELADACIVLTPYGVHVRYPNEIDVIESDMEQAIKMAGMAMDFVKPILEERYEQQHNNDVIKQ